MQNQDEEAYDIIPFPFPLPGPLMKPLYLERQERYLVKIGVTQDNFPEKMLEAADYNDALITVRHIMLKYVLPPDWGDLPPEERDACKIRETANAQRTEPIPLSEAQQRLLADAQVTPDNFHQKAMKTLEYHDRNRELLRAIIIKYILPLQKK